MMQDERDPRTYAIIGAAMEVHRTLGHGFLEPVYQEALAIELELQNIPHQREVGLPIRYKDRVLSTGYRADFIYFNREVLVEIKALSELSSSWEAQVINYLKATGIEVGLLINFGVPSLQYKRLVLTKR